MSFIHNLTDVRIVPQKLGILQCVQTMLNIMRGRYCTQIPIDILFQISPRFRGPCGLSGNTGYKWQYYFFMFIEVVPVCSAVSVVGGNALSETLHFKFFQCQFSPSSGSVATASRLFLLSMRFAGFWLVGRRWRHWDSRQIPPGILAKIQQMAFLKYTSIVSSQWKYLGSKSKLVWVSWLMLAAPDVEGLLMLFDVKWWSNS